MSLISIPVSIEGRCIISDDLGNILLDKNNKIHPMNMSCAFARGLSHEPNHFIHRISFGNGGTFVDATNNVIFNTPNVGLKDSYKSRLHNETYSEIIDDNNTENLLSTGIGSSPQNDPIGSPNAKNGPGVISKEIIDPTNHELNHSQVIITCVLNKNEPLSQFITQTAGNTILEEDTNTVFSFDEIGIFTDGITSDIPTNGTHSAYIDTPNLFVNCGLSTDTDYDLILEINNEPHPFQIRFSSDDIPDNNITFIKLVNVLSKTISNVAYCYMDNGTNTETAYYNFLTFKNKLTGSKSKITVVQDTLNPQWLFNNIPLFVEFNNPLNGTDIGLQNSPNDPQNEFSRLLSHLIFEPILKPSDRIIIIKYIYNIYVTDKK
jgi:hypothetical protein